jgi:hypothetical protein
LLLPFVDLLPVHEQYDFNRRFDHNKNAKTVALILPIYICPSQPDRGKVDNRYGPNHYAGSAGTIPGVNDGVLFPLSSVRFAELTDGASNTIATGELAHEFGGWARGAINAGSGGGGGGGGGGSGGGGSGGGGGQGFARGVMRWWKAAPNCAQPGMNPPKTNCSNSAERRFQFSSAHQGGCHFFLCDASGRFVGQSIDDDAFRALITREGAETSGLF